MADSDRLETLEIELAHLQRLFEQLNEVVTAEALRADRQQQQLKQLQQQLKELKEKQSSDERFDPLDEKPPHY